MSVEGFDLVDEPWITCLTSEGRSEEVSLLGLFARAAELREIVGDLPTQGFALLRLALAVLHRALDGPRDEDDWAELWKAGQAPLNRIEAYLRRHEGSFDLFDPDRPFFQTTGLRTAKGEFFGLERLVADVPTGHPYFTTRIGAGLDRLTPAEAARWLVHLHAFDVSGIKSGIVGDPRVKGGRVYPLGTSWAGNLGGLSIEGETLWETLVLNLIPRDQPSVVQFGAKDRASWEVEPAGPAVAEDLAVRPYGPVDLYTWQSRRALLRGGREGVTGVVIGYGDPLAPANRFLLEPMTAWRHSEPQEKKLGLPLVYMPQGHDPAKALWRGLSAILPTVSPRGKADDRPRHITAGVVDWVGRALGGERPVALRAVGMEYGTQSAVVTDIVDDRLVVRATLFGPVSAGLQHMVASAVEATDSAVLALKNLASNLVRAAGGTDPNLADGARARAAEAAYATLDQPFRAWLSGLGPDSDADSARAEWSRTAYRAVRELGERLMAATGPNAWVGREVGGRRVTSPEADGWFRTALAAALPRPPKETGEGTDD